MKKVYLIRHGLPDFPGGKGMCLGITDIPLSKAGLTQAAQMAAQLPPVTAVFSSPLSRAVQTAQAIGQSVTILEGLRELSFGQWDGLTFDQIREKFPELYAARGNDPTLLLPEQENPAIGLSRFESAMEEAAKQSPGDFAVVAHGGIIAQFLQNLTGTWYKPGYTEVLTLFWNNGIFEIKEPVST
ncbi:MAG: histidine phosphatase family protein [Oscillospiraceae bacterium]|nr:histidine phosphatase family protein [Oscillospiraceae bacterium]